MKRNPAIVVVSIVLLALVYGCMEQKPVQRMEDLRSLKGRASKYVIDLLGPPAVVDSSISDTEHIWGYYQVMIRSEVDAKPRQRTVLVTLKKQRDTFYVDKVSVP
ncbi:MAG: hypothetical protein ABI623_10850 [bacterium]